ncbi:Eukaryotic translation initiation factor 3 subunit G, N-terminal, partial [Dillenia turbinata]
AVDTKRDQDRVNQPPPSKLRRAEVVDNEAKEEEEEEASLQFLLPPPVTIGPVENGVKKVIQYKFNGDENKIKISTNTRLRKLADSRLNKRALQRRSWAKFGEGITAKKAEEANLTADSLSQLGKGAAVLTVCRACGKKRDHWTSRCPYMDFSSQVDDTGPLEVISLLRGVYVAPSMRAGGERSGGSDTRHRNDENTLRIINLSLYARESDLLELFGVFGPLNRACDNLILHVDWSQPKAN